MLEKPIIIKWASVQDAQEKQAQRLEDLNKQYNIKCIYADRSPRNAGSVNCN